MHTITTDQLATPVIDLDDATLERFRDEAARDDARHRPPGDARVRPRGDRQVGARCRPDRTALVRWAR
jgi:hypothetical protein